MIHIFSVIYLLWKFWINSLQKIYNARDNSTHYSLISSLLQIAKIARQDAKSAIHKKKTKKYTNLLYQL